MQTSRHPYLKTVLLCLLVGLLSLAPCLLANGGQLVYYGDYFRQYVPFLQETRRMLASGSLAWSWNTFLGDGFYSAYSYYTSVNPFAYLALLFPDSLLLYGTLCAQLAKFAVSGVCCYAYLNRFVKKEDLCVLGALLYTFSGFTIINNNYYFFLDVIAVFPLLLLGIELVGEKRSLDACLFLMLAVFVNAEINYYFLVSSGILCVLYALLRFELWRQPLSKLKLLGQLAGSAALGIGMAGFLLLPALWKMMHTPKATGSLGSLYLRPYSIGNMLERIRIFFMPIENNIEHAFYRSGSWTSTAVFLAVFGSSLALLFFVRNRHHWLTRLSAVLFVFLMIPVLNSCFNLFTDFSYTRWLYGMVLLLVLATVTVLDTRESIGQAALKRYYVLSLCITAVLSVPPTIVCILERMGISTPLSRLYDVGTSTIYAGLKGIALSFALTIVSYAVLAVFIRKPSVSLRTMLSLVCAVCVLNNTGYLFFYNYINEHRLSNMQSELAVLTPSEQTTYSYRTDSSAGNQNLSLFENAPSVSGYHSLQNQNSVRFAVAAGYTDTSTTIVLDRPEADSDAIDTLLSVKYYTDLGNDETASVPNGFTLISDENGVKTYENENYLPFGFAYPAYITEEESAQSDLSKAQLMLLGLVVSDESSVSDILPKLDIPSASEFALSEAADVLRTQSTSSFEGTSRGFSAAITLDRDNLVFFSVPNDEGWTATVNGQPVDIQTVNYGLCAVRCPSGNSQIEFTYHTPYLTAGCALSAVCAAVFVLLLLIFVLRKKKS